MRRFQIVPDYKRGDFRKKKRYTIMNIKSHKFFKNNDWVNILMRKERISNIILVFSLKNTSKSVRLRRA